MKHTLLVSIIWFSLWVVSAFALAADPVMDEDRKAYLNAGEAQEAGAEPRQEVPINDDETRQTEMDAGVRDEIQDAGARDERQ